MPSTNLTDCANLAHLLESQGERLVNVRWSPREGSLFLVGSLNIYSYTASAFDPFDEALMGMFSVAAGQAITNARRWQHSRETVTQLERALISRPEIEMAKGALMALHGCSADEAFAKLADHSQRRNIKLHVIAKELLETLRPALTE